MQHDYTLNGFPFCRSFRLTEYFEMACNTDALFCAEFHSGWVQATAMEIKTSNVSDTLIGPMTVRKPFWDHYRLCLNFYKNDFIYLVTLTLSYLNEYILCFHTFPYKISKCCFGDSKEAFETVRIYLLTNILYCMKFVKYFVKICWWMAWCSYNIMYYRTDSRAPFY